MHLVLRFLKTAVGLLQSEPRNQIALLASTTRGSHAPRNRIALLASTTLGSHAPQIQIGHGV